MGKVKIGNPKCRCGRVGTSRSDGRTRCDACWSAASHQVDDDDEAELIAAIESIAAGGIAQALWSATIDDIQDPADDAHRAHAGDNCACADDD